MRVDQFDTPNFTRLGLASLAATLREAGHKVCIVDAKYERLSDHQIARRAQQFRPELVGLTAFTNEVKSAAQTARALRKVAPNATYVLGGTHVSALPRRSVQEFPEFDYLVLGEGEETIVELADGVERNTPPIEVAGVAYQQAGEVVVTAKRTPPELDRMPPPAWDLLPSSERYLVMTQRGCPFKCNFCQNPNGRRVRHRPIKQVVDEIEGLLDVHHAKELLVCDEIFTVDNKRTLALLEAMIDARIGERVKWWAQTHVNVCSQEIFEKMRAAGCYRVGLGIESGDAESLKLMKKGITRERIVRARNWARSAGLAVEGLFIIGHPGETWQSAMQTVRFAVELNPEVPIFSVMTPYPGTEIAKLAESGALGYRLLSDDWDDYAKQIGDSIELEGFPRWQIELAQMLGYARVFLENQRFAEFTQFAWKYRAEGWAVVRKLLTGRMPQTPVTEPRSVRRTLRVVG